MRKIIVLFFCMFLVSFGAFSQDDYTHQRPRPKNCATENSCPRNTLFHETTIRFDKLGFNWNSINWDHILVCRLTYLVSFRLGVDYMAFRKVRAVGAPIELNLMLGGGKLMFETGIGLNYLYIYKNYSEDVRTQTAEKLNYLSATGRLGLRFQRQHGIFARAGYTPMYSLMNNEKITVENKKGVAVVHDKLFYSMYGIAIGYTF